VRLYRGWGQGPRPIQPAPRHRDKVPLPSSSLNLCELDPEEQCRKKEGGMGKKEVKGGRGRIISLGNKCVFLRDNNGRARFHLN